MAFTTKLILKKDKEELFPGKTVLIQHAYITNEESKVNTKFTLNKDAIVAFGMQPYTPNVNNITWGVDDETGDTMLANMAGEAKTSKITADNTFSDQAFLTRLVKEFKINPEVENVFELTIFAEGELKVANIKPLVEVTRVEDEPYPGFNKMIEETPEDNPDVDSSPTFDEAMETERNAVNIQTEEGAKSIW